MYLSAYVYVCAFLSLIAVCLICIAPLISAEAPAASGRKPHQTSLVS